MTDYDDNTPANPHHHQFNQSPLPAGLFITTPEGLPLERIAAVRRMTVNPGESLVLRTDQHLNEAQRARLVEMLAKVLPEGVAVVTLGPGWEMEVVAAGPKGQQDAVA